MARARKPTDIIKNENLYQIVLINIFKLLDAIEMKMLEGIDNLSSPKLILK
mgnify:CR=1 FL=1